MRACVRNSVFELCMWYECACLCVCMMSMCMCVCMYVCSICVQCVLNIVCECVCCVTVQNQFYDTSLQINRTCIIYLYSKGPNSVLLYMQTPYKMCACFLQAVWGEHLCLGLYVSVHLFFVLFTFVTCIGA